MKTIYTEDRVRALELAADIQEAGGWFGHGRTTDLQVPMRCVGIALAAARGLEITEAAYDLASNRDFIAFCEALELEPANDTVNYEERYVTAVVRWNNQVCESREAAADALRRAAEVTRLELEVNA